METFLEDQNPELEADARRGIIESYFGVYELLYLTFRLDFLAEQTLIQLCSGYSIFEKQ